MTIPVFKPKMNKERIFAELEKIFDSGWIGLGPKTSEFENKFAEFIGVKHASAVNSCTAALHLALLAAGIGEGDEVLVPSMTFASTALACLYVGATPVFVDIEPDTLNVSAEDLEKKITPKTKAMIVVHFGGHACDMERMTRISAKHNIKLIEDCAHAAGGEYKGKKLGSFGLLACFSFHAVKNLPTGDGGMITTCEKALHENITRLRWLGINKDTWARSGGKYSWRYSIEELGYKYHMNDIAAVIGLAQLETLEKDNADRKRLAERYAAGLSGTPGLDLPVEKNYARSAWHNFVVKVPAGKRDDLHKYLADNGISTGVHYEPIHFHPVFAGKCVAKDLRVTESVWKRLLTLPLYPELAANQQTAVIESIKKNLRS